MRQFTAYWNISEKSIKMINKKSMKREIIPPSRGLLILYRVIIVLFFVVIVIIAAGSLYALFRPSASEPLFRTGRDGGDTLSTRGSMAVSGLAVSGLADDTDAVFTGIGRLRIPAAGQPPATVILSISFPYPVSDRPFTEELASCIGEFRSIAIGYFSSRSLENIVNMDEETAKAEILRRYNALLRLGKIDTLYFGDLMIVE